MGCFIKMEQAVSRILVSDKPSDNVGFKNPTYVCFSLGRGQSPRYVCSDNVGFKNPTYVYLNGFNNFSDDLSLTKVV